MPRLKDTVLKVMVTVIVALAVGGLAPVHSQVRQTYFDQPAEVILPATYGPGFAYSIIVVLPYTGGTARDQLQRTMQSIDVEDYILILPAGRPLADHYLPNFMSYVQWYENRIRADLERVSREHWVRMDRVFIVGFSLGGDLSWALSVKNPELFAGAVMIGTRASYPVSAAALAHLEGRGFRAAFITGVAELAARYDGINAARRRLSNAGIETWYREVPGQHVNAQPANMREAFHFIAGY